MTTEMENGILVKGMPMNISKNFFFFFGVASVIMVQIAKGTSAKSETLKFPMERLPWILFIL